jgi:hypothetical protein
MLRRGCPTLVPGRSAGCSLVQSVMRLRTSSGHSSGTLGSCSRPRFTGVVRVTICIARQHASSFVYRQRLLCGHAPAQQ